MELSELFMLAKSIPDYDQFETIVKSKLTGMPVTVKNDVEVIIMTIDKKLIIKQIKQRIKDEYRKYKNTTVSWIDTSAHKIYSNLFK